MSEYPPSQAERHPPWNPDQGFVSVARELRALREGEKRGGTIAKRTERVLNLLTPDETGRSFVERYASTGAPLALWPDANGLRLDLGRDNDQGIHSHIPYEFVTDEALSGAAALMPEGPLADLRVRAALARGSENAADLSKRQEERFFRATAFDTLPELLQAPLTDRLAPFLAGETLPAESYEDYLTSSEGAEKERIMTLVALAGALNASGSDQHDALRQPAPSLVANTMSRKRETPRFTRAVFEHREKALNESPLNAEVSKILSVVFEQYDAETLRKAHVESVRGAFADGKEFVAFYSPEQYERVLIDPAKHLRGSGVPAHYQKIPLVKNAEFEAFEGLMLPYFHLRTLAAELTDIQREDASAHGEHILSVLSLLVTELSPAQYEPLYLAGKEFGTDLTKGRLNAAAKDAFGEQLNLVLAHYGERFSGPALEILDRYLKLPERSTLTFDDAFLEQAPERIREKMRAYRSTLPIKEPTTTVIRSGTEHNIPFAFEGRALRALSIENRPALTLICGAKYENVEEQALLDRLAQALMSAGVRAKANTFMQGTQSGKIAETVVRTYWEYRAALPEGQEPETRIMAVEPGRSIYSGSLGYPDSELREAQAPLPIDTILTPYLAGWSPSGTLHSYLSHLVLRQSIIRHSSDGRPRVAIVVNGGAWSVPECIESIRDGAPLVVLPESGRLAAFLGHLNKTRETWWSKGAAGGMNALETFVSEHPKEEQERMRQDLALMEQRGLRELLELVTLRGTIIETTTDTLEDTLVSLLSPKE